MKKTLINYSWIIVSLLIFSLCESKKEDTQSTNEDIEPDTPKEVFVANPQDVEERDVTTLKINESAPDFVLPGVDGKFYSLDDFDDSKVLVIIFTCNHCPTAQAYEDRIIQIVKDYKPGDVRVVAISPNSVKTLLLEELGYSDMGDSYEDMKIRAKDKDYNFVYLYDGDTQETSIKYGPVATPHAFVFNRERKLKYTGRLDNSEKPGTANAEDLRNAIDAALVNAEILQPVTKTFGCSVKWGWKRSWTDKVNEDWTKKPVALNEIDEDGVEKLMKNENDKLLLLNIWATWCGPCIIEYPEFLNIQRMYGERDFEFISLSADKLDQKEAALKFLQKKYSSVANYIFAGDDIYRLIASVDPEWDGALPYTVLLEPGGKVVFKKMGTIEPLEVKKTIVDHPMIGRYY